MNPILRILRRCLLLPLVLLLYLGAAILLGLLPQNAAFHSGTTGIRILLISNGVHSGLILPIQAAGIDWTRLFPASQTGAGHLQPGWDSMEIGWGDRQFYLETPNRSDLNLITALSALTGLNDSVLHVEYQPTPKPAADTVALTLSPAGYRRLAAYIRSSAILDGTGTAHWLPGRHYDNNDAFYAAHGHYSPFVTCNQWVRNGLAVAGVRVPLWAPFDKALFWQLR